MMNYFKIFSLKEEFAIDLSELEKKYLELQNQFHPDKSSIAEIEKSMMVNEGYKVLADDFLRACHILALQGIDIINDEKAANVDIATLQEILELQENIAEIINLEEIAKLQNEINSEIKLLIAEAIKYFPTNDFEILAQFLIKAKYLKKSLQDLKERKRKI